MSESASAVVRRLFERYAQAGPEGAIELVAEDAVFVVPPEISAEPDVYEGHEGARRYFAGFEGAIDEVRIELVEVQDASPGTALGEVSLSGLGTTTRIPVQLTTFMTFAVRDGLVAQIAAHPDLESARRELEL